MAEKMLNDIKQPLPSYKAPAWIFVVFVMAALLVPLVGMLWAPSDSTSENRELADVPALVRDGSWNVGFLSDAGAYFTDHFAYRENLVDADARLFSSAFGISTADNVIFGDDGWLYYAGTLADYQDRDPLREREARNIAHNIRMLQDWCVAQGADFAFTVVPDKNSLYPEQMPGYYPQVENDDMDLLKEWLSSYGVNFVDMHEVMQSADGVQYFLRDSHWSDKGALLGHDAIAKALDLKTAGITQDELEMRDDYIGDLNQMLFPVSAEPEDDWYAEGINDGSGETATQRSGEYWDYIEGADPTDSVVVTEPSTESPYSSVAASNGSMLMFRDSFAISLLPYFAVETEHGRFDKMVPYNGLQVLDEAYDSVVVERAQRHMADLAEGAFIMPCPTVQDDFSDLAEADGASATCDVKVEGSLVSLSGEVFGIDLKPDDGIFIRLTEGNGDSRMYEAFALTGDGSDNGYAVNIGSDAWLGKKVMVEVLVVNGYSANEVDRFDLIIS